MHESVSVLTSVGRYQLAVEREEVTEFSYIDAQRSTEVSVVGSAVSPLVSEVITELTEYFLGERHVFSLPVHLKGTDFQKLVWQTLLQVPFGAAVSYAELAEMCGKPRAARAVGNALNKNHLGIFVPCHRVLAAGGKLGGFGMGLETKRLLLQHEGVVYRE